MKLAIAAKVAGSRYICTKPSYVPALQQPTDCDRRVYDWREGGTAQSASKESKAPTIVDGKTADILEWVRRTLDYLCVNAGRPDVRIAAGMLLSDGDVPVSLATLEVLGNQLLDRLHLDKPWQT